MVSLNKSFLYGICFASLTWIISLYLYIKLTHNEPQTVLLPSKLTLEYSGESLNSIEQSKKIIKYRSEKWANRVTNSERLKKKLQPVLKTYNSTDSGKFILLRQSKFIDGFSRFN